MTASKGPEVTSPLGNPILPLLQHRDPNNQELQSSYFHCFLTYNSCYLEFCSSQQARPLIIISTCFSQIPSPILGMGPSLDPLITASVCCTVPAELSIEVVEPVIVPQRAICCIPWQECCLPGLSDL